MKKNIGIIIQSRLTSSRFPKKVIQKIKSLTVSEILFKRVQRVKKVKKIIFTIPNTIKNNFLDHHLKSIGANVFRGNEKDVLERYYHTANKIRLIQLLELPGLSFN